MRASRTGNGRAGAWERLILLSVDYTKWENFSKVIGRAMIACENSGHRVTDDFPEVRKIVEAAKAFLL